LDSARARDGGGEAEEEGERLELEEVWSRTSLVVALLLLLLGAPPAVAFFIAFLAFFLAFFSFFFSFFSFFLSFFSRFTFLPCM
jgi:hypothetical protein